VGRPPPAINTVFHRVSAPVATFPSATAKSAGEVLSDRPAVLGAASAPSMDWSRKWFDASAAVSLRR
jgi:hypothetical protein